MPGFNEQPKQTLTADTKSGDVSITERMEALHALVKRGRKPEEEHAYIKEALRIVTAMYAGIERPKDMEPQVVDIPNNCGIKKESPRISPDGKYFSAVLGVKTFGEYLLLSNNEGDLIEAKTSIEILSTVRGRLFRVNALVGDFKILDENGKEIFQLSRFANVSTRELELSKEGIAYRDKSTGDSRFFSYNDLQSYPCKETAFEAEVLAGKTVLTYFDNWKDGNKFVISIDGKLLSNVYSEIYTKFEHDGKVKFVVSQKNRFGLKVFLVDESGSEKLLYQERRWGFDKDPYLSTIFVGVKENHLDVIAQVASDVSKRWEDVAALSFDLNGKVISKDGSVDFVGEHQGRKIFARRCGKKGTNQVELLNEHGESIKGFPSNFLPYAITGSPYSTRIGDELYISRVKKKENFYEVVNLSGKVVPVKFISVPKILNVGGRLLIIGRESTTDKVDSYFLEDGRKLAFHYAKPIEYRGKLAFVISGEIASSLIDENEKVLIDEMPFEPDELRTINGRDYAFKNLEVQGKGKDVFDVKNKKHLVFSTVKMVSDDNILFVAIPSVGFDWSCYDYNLNPIGEKYEEVYDTRINNGKVWVLGKRGDQLVYEPAGNVIE